MSCGEKVVSVKRRWLGQVGLGSTNDWDGEKREETEDCWALRPQMQGKAHRGGAAARLSTVSQRPRWVIRGLGGIVPAQLDHDAERGGDELCFRACLEYAPGWAEGVVAWGLTGYPIHCSSALCLCPALSSFQGRLSASGVGAGPRGRRASDSGGLGKLPRACDPELGAGV